ncbi:MAG TPA: MFS transporter [Candidatus Binatia bacterium]
MTEQITDRHPQPTGRFDAFRYRDFRLFWLSLFISNTGTWMQMTAVNWLLYQLTESPLQLGINGLFRSVPAIALGIFSGTLADRYDRKKLLLVTQSLLGSLALLLGVLDHSDNIRPWHIYTITFFSAAVGSCDGPARQALFPSLVPRAVLPNAVALNSILWKGAALLGPMLGGIAISLIGTSGAFYANAASFLVVILALVLMKTHSLPSEQWRHIVEEMKAGISFVYSHKVIFGVIIMEATTSIFGLDNAMLTIFASDVLRVGAHGFGLLQSARGLGAVIGSFLFITAGQRPYQGKILLVSALLYGAGFAFFGVAPSFPLALLLLTFVGAVDTIWASARSTILQWVAPDRLRGRVMGIFQLSNQGLNPLGQVETGLLVPVVGARAATVIGGLIVSAVTIATSLKLRELPRFSLDAPSPEPTRAKALPSLN